MDEEKYTGGNVTDLRKGLGITQRELSDRISVPLQTLRYWETHPQMILKAEHSPKLDALIAEIHASDSESANVQKNFKKKLVGNFSKIKFVQDAVALFIVVKDPAVTVYVKAMAIGALAYFISPIDAIPDIIPVTGFLDDAAVIGTTITVLGSKITKRHRQQAEGFLQNL
jgi:uncharacterized membrane protein YkvA (DUF1232 family)